MNHSHIELASGIRLHYRDSGTALPPLLLLHSLSDNTHAFDAVIAAGLDRHFRIIAPDLRGRGKSSRPATGYGLEDHSTDLIELLDSLGIDQPYIAGHSFGALLALYVASHYPRRVSGLAMIDAAAELHPLTPGFVLMLSDRLGKWYPDTETYLTKLRMAPFMRYWDADMRRAFMADTEVYPDGSVQVLTQKVHIAQCAAAVQAVSKSDWRRWAQRLHIPALVLVASEPFILGHHILQERKALETAVLLPEGELHEVRGNHVNMLFGKGASDIAAHIIAAFAGRTSVPQARPSTAA